MDILKDTDNPYRYIIIRDALFLPSPIGRPVSRGNTRGDLSRCRLAKEANSLRVICRLHPSAGTSFRRSSLHPLAPGNWRILPASSYNNVGLCNYTR